MAVTLTITEALADLKAGSWFVLTAVRFNALVEMTDARNPGGLEA